MLIEFRRVTVNFPLCLGLHLLRVDDPSRRP